MVTARMYCDRCRGLKAHAMLRTGNILKAKCLACHERQRQREQRHKATAAQGKLFR
jgi:ribosomal protein L44E